MLGWKTTNLPFSSLPKPKTITTTKVHGLHWLFLPIFSQTTTGTLPFYCQSQGRMNLQQVLSLVLYCKSAEHALMLRCITLINEKVSEEHMHCEKQ